MPAPCNNIPWVHYWRGVRGYGCRMSDVGCRVSGLGTALGTGLGTVLGTVLALLLYNSDTAPALAWPMRNPVYALVRPWLVRAPGVDHGTPVTPGTPLLPRTLPSPSVVRASTGTAARQATGLTPGCTSGHMHQACHLAR